MVNFSFMNQAFYDAELPYSELPHDLIAITSEKHLELLSALNKGCIVFGDLTYSEPKPSQFHEWHGDEWIDQRKLTEIAEYERSLLQPLTKRQFSLYLYDIGKYDQVMGALNANPRFKIEFDTVATIERSSSTVAAMGQILGWDNLMIDEKWREASKL
ncbi:MAG TPA: hypothetical protein DCM65_06020 [Acinetobacter junii]|nr:hypothetical protein [Acinetobacter junii]